jgi:tRNA pseudouridine32 synthase/23S rRNA pseudouridine746 synthase
MESTPGILWADAALLVIDKPAGLRSLPDGYDPALPYVRRLLEPQYGRLWMVHRLDKETSGVLVLARSAAAHRSLNTQFEQHQVRKWYHALAAGGPQWEATTVDLPLRPDGDRRHRSVVDPQHGKPAVTHLRLLERFPQAALVEAQPETGRAHQIRAHLAAVGLPILADRLYGGPPLPGLDALALHAYALALVHPESGQEMRFEAPYPPAFQAAITWLRQSSPLSPRRGACPEHGEGAGGEGTP